MKSIKIGNKKIGGEELFFTVEEGNTNWGSFQKALEIIDTTAKTGADAIEFQLARADDFYVMGHEGHALFSKLEFTKSEIAELISRANEVELEMVATVLSENLIDILVQAECSVLNINASDLTNPVIIDAVVDSGLPFFLSLPLATEKEIDWAVNRVIKKEADGFVLLHGQHIMASSDAGLTIEKTALGYIQTLKDIYEVPAGYIDHSINPCMPSCAAAAGADVVTKHLTLNRQEKGPDWHICLEPDEMKDSIKMAKSMYLSIKTKNKEVIPEEKADRLVMRRSIVASREIKSGETLSLDNICFRRPGGGLDPIQAEKIIGRKTLKDILPYQMIKNSDLEGE